MPKSYTFEALGLLHGAPDTGLVNIVNLASLIFEVPMSFVTVIDRPRNRQFFAAGGGAHADRADPRGVALRHSVCRLVQEAGRTVAIADLACDPRTRDNPVLKEHGLRAYLGSPIHALTGKIVGTICCWSHEPRTWSARDVAMLEQLAMQVDDVVQLRALERQTSACVQRRRREQAGRAGYVAHLGHEIRTPLTGIVAATRMLDQSSDPEQTTRLVGILDRSATKLLHFVSDVMDLAEVDRAEPRSADTVLSLPEMARHLLTEAAAAADDKGLALICEDLLGPVQHRVDAAALTTILRKLIGNAIRFTDEGSVTLRLQEDAYGQVLIDVADTGCGIPADFQSRIFEAFEDADPNSARAFGGTGLGMALLRRLIEGMDGTISVQSAVGQGATFCIALPLQAVADSPAEG